ncbi:MAG: formate/nitrite transporter family protein [Gaiellales bacterium]|nr:formate/nitrite transporter family protein [Gaiellales bacterium]
MTPPPAQLNCYLPGEVAGNACTASKAKSNLTVPKLMVLAILAGAYIGFGANLATTIGCDSAKFLGNGVGQLLFGSVFSVGLMLVVIAGSELFTGNAMFMAVGALEGTISWGALIRNWVIVWIFNFVGSLILVFIIYGAFYGGDSVGLFKGSVGAKAIAIAKGKVELAWWAAFFRAILCNWLVCLAVWLALASKDVIGKIFGIFFPIMAFVASGFEHSVANMFFIPIGILVSGHQPILDLAAQSVLTPDQIATLASGGALPEAAQTAFDGFKAAVSGNLTWGALFTKNLIPVTIGNIVGGSIFVASSYWFSYLRKPKEAAESK